MKKKIVLPFDMSLRLSSDTVPLDGTGGRLGVAVEHLHVKGRPMTDTGPAAGRLARRHYASLAHEKGTTFSDADEWLRRTSRTVQSDRELVGLLETKQVEAVFWVAIFGNDPVPTPPPDPDIVSAIADVHSQLVIENYTAGGPECSTKTWFPNRAA